MKRIGIIGGSGFYNLGEEEITVSTDFGKVTVSLYKVGSKKEIIFLPRHGKKHSVSPTNVNYRANILALYQLGVKGILVTNAVGSMYYQIKPGDLVIPHDIIDFTKKREYTFFDGNFSIKINGIIKKGVVHTDVSHPFDEKLRRAIYDVSKSRKENMIWNGVIAVTEGPRFETPAEIFALKKLGATLAGMTTSPEVFLANELDIPYATLAVVTNYVAGMQREVTHTEVIEIFNKKVPVVREILLETAKKILEDLGD